MAITGIVHVTMLLTTFCYSEFGILRGPAHAQTLRIHIMMMARLSSSVLILLVCLAWIAVFISIVFFSKCIIETSLKARLSAVVGECGILLYARANVCFSLDIIDT